MRTRYPELAEWAKSFLGIEFRPWQRQVLERALEVDEDDLWCWPIVLVLVPRQRGKSLIVRALGSWMASQGLLALQVSNRGSTAMEVWRGAALPAENAGWRVTYARDQPTIFHPSGGRYLCQAANDRAGVGYTVDGVALLDEVWDIKREVYDHALSPALSAVDNPFTFMVSTAGDGESALLHHYREAGLSKSRTVMLAEWSAPPGADWLDEDVWEQADPHWDERRRKFLRSQVEVIGEATFRSQYLCQWVQAAHGWMSPSMWAACAGTVDARADVVALESSLEGDRHYLARSYRDEDGAVHVALEVLNTWPDVDARLKEIRAPKVLASPAYIDRLATPFTLTGSRELDPAMRVTIDLVARKALVHPDDERLTEQVLTARQHVTRSGAQTIFSPNGRGLSAVRSMLWAVGAASAVNAGRPRLRVAR